LNICHYYFIDYATAWHTCHNIELLIDIFITFSVLISFHWYSLRHWLASFDATLILADFSWGQLSAAAFDYYLQLISYFLIYCHYYSLLLHTDCACTRQPTVHWHCFSLPDAPLPFILLMVEEEITTHFWYKRLFTFTIIAGAI